MVCNDQFKLIKKKIPGKPRKPIYDFSNWGTKRFIIMDESHMVKNLAAKQTNMLKLHIEPFQYRFELSGTPAPKGVEDYYSQLHLLDPTIIGKPYQGFKEEIATIGTQYSDYEMGEYIPEKVKEFENYAKPWVSRELTKGNIDLPPLIEVPTYCALSEKQVAIYQEIVTYSFTRIKEATDGQITTHKVKGTFPFAMQALENPCMLKGKVSKELSSSLYNKVLKWKFKDNGKLEILDALIKKHVVEGGEKIIIWSGHPSSLDSLQELYGEKYGAVALHGSNKVKDKTAYREEVLEDFRTNPKRKILLASYLALATAINLVESSVSIYFDLPTAYEKFGQSRKRNHRIGQDRRVMCYYLIMAHTAEETNYRSLVLGKGLRNETLFNTELTLSMDVWKKIFTGEYNFETTSKTRKTRKGHASQLLNNSGTK